jgi:hypothetical protein
VARVDLLVGSGYRVGSFSLEIQMNQYWVMVKYKDEPGSGFGRVVVNADNPYQAIQMAKSMYGRLLISESANPV